MSFGLRMWGADGSLQLDETSFTMRVVLSTTVNFPASGAKAVQSFSVPGCNASNSVAIVVPNGSYTTNLSTQYETEMVNDVANVYNYNRGFDASLTSNVTSMRLYVIRFA
ncbi:hypothetical protein [Pseudomonas sp. NA-150]|uniref:hypothetical protein n=1 Tax=Pseudomonas sp. NA-150 TaxID=3367525 RepID=UPI0037CAD3AB